MRWICIFGMVLALGCQSYQAPLYKMGELETNRPASSITNSKTQKGMTVGAKLYADSRFSQKFFGLDVVYDGFIPILVAMENEPENNSFEIFPSKMTLTLLAGAKRITLRAIHINKCGYSLQVEKDVETKLFPEWKLTGGAKKNGFVLFDARQYGWGEEELNKLLKNSLLEIPLKKNKLNRPKDLKEGADLSKYRGENITFKILFE